LRLLFDLFRGASQRQYLSVLLFLVGVGGIAWLIPSDAEAIWIIRIGTFVAAFFAGVHLMLAGETVGSELPDLLLPIQPYFEREGLGFSPAVFVRDGSSWFKIYCQNRYDRPVAALVCIIPRDGLSKTGDHSVKPVIVQVELQGSEVAAVVIPFDIADDWQGQIMVFDVLARAVYPQGQGLCVRPRRGLPVGEPRSAWQDTATALLSLVQGHIVVEKTASFEVRLPAPPLRPSGVSDDILQTETLWPQAHVPEVPAAS
jgi:hypothetical protein